MGKDRNKPKELSARTVSEEETSIRVELRAYVEGEAAPSRLSVLWLLCKEETGRTTIDAQAALIRQLVAAVKRAEAAEQREAEALRADRERVWDEGAKAMEDHLHAWEVAQPPNTPPIHPPNPYARADDNEGGA
jgi:hypothetical protein